MTSAQIKKELKTFISKEKASFYPKFFKCSKGEYGEGDKFLGVTVPNQRKIAQKHKEASLKVIKDLLESKYHEHRLTGLLILTYKFPKADKKAQKDIYKFYLKHINAVNNWDLVDLSAPKILGAYLLVHHQQRKILYDLAKSKNLWQRRIAILSTYTFIKNNDFKDALQVSEILLNDEHDLIHKAVGWMLREIGKINQETEEKFLKSHYKKMPRTMLRYAIEKFSESKRKFYMAK